MSRNGKNNKGGRPKGAVSEATRAKMTAKEILVKMVEANIVPLTEALIGRALDKDTMAARELMDRTWGRAPQSVELTGKDGYELFKRTPEETALAVEHERKLKALTSK